MPGVGLRRLVVPLQNALAREAFANQKIIERAWVVLRRTCYDTDSFEDIPSPMYPLRPEYVVFLCNVAEAMGFRMVLLSLEGVWAQATSGESKEYEVAFRDGSALPASTPKFFSTHDIWIDEEEYPLVCKQVLSTASLVLPTELLSVLWLLSFLLQLDVGADSRLGTVTMEELKEILALGSS